MKQERLIASTLPRIYRRLDRAFDKHTWWPAQSAFEVIVGAILTQNTAWRNVELALERLKAARALTPTAIARLPSGRLEQLIRPAGFYQQKTRYLRAFTSLLRQRYRGSVARMWRTRQPALRSILLQVPGIGPETADSILLYAGRRPAFVVDAYTRRILSRHLLVAPTASYEAVQRYCVARLPVRVAAYHRCHALLVEAGKRYCRPVPRCAICPLRDLTKQRRF